MTTERDRANQLAFATNKGVQQGLEQGLEQGRKDTAMNLLKMGMSVEDIAKATGLSLDVILSMKDTL